MAAYYNEVDAHAVRWLRNLIAKGLIPPGDVDGRSIVDVQPGDLAGYTQCHFFAGIGGWGYAAQLAGWPDDRPLWTGSCPCQPFSVAGKGGGIDDSRHLWPHFFRLISASRPPVVMGEQVAGKAGYGWLDGVRADLEGEGYASRGVDIPACAVDAPHIRSRLYWVATNRGVANSKGVGSPSRHAEPLERGRQPGRPKIEPERCHDFDRRGGVVNSASVGYQEDESERAGLWTRRDATAGANEPGRVGDSDGARRQRCATHTGDDGDELKTLERTDVRYGQNGSFWAGAEWISCHDEKARRAQPGSPLLVDGLPGRVALWRGIGNAINPVLAAEVIGAYLDTELAG